jgi:protein ImuB
MEKRFVSIWFPHLYTDWLASRKPELKNIPFVVVAPSHGKMIIRAVNHLAAQHGIHVHMALADARAIYTGLQSFDELPTLTNKLLKRIAAWCIRFTPVASVDNHDGIILEATGCAHLWGGEQNYLADILQRLHAKGYAIKAAIAGTIGTAWAMARFGDDTIVQKHKHADALLSLPPQALRLEPETVERLHKLGLHQISTFISMPRTALRRRFGNHILTRLNQALGIEEEFIQPIFPVEAYEERWPCLEPICTRTGIEIALKNLLQSLCTRLQKEAKGSRELIFKGFRIDNKEVAITITTNAPSNNPNHLFHLLEIKLALIEPGLGIELFILHANKVEEHSASQQQLFKNNAVANNILLAELIDRLSVKIGAENIHRYLPAEHHWPERSFTKAVSLTEQPATQWRNDKPRPIQLLPQPERIEVTAPVPDYPPMHFRYKGKLHKVIRADGPERIEQEWWLQQGQHRDYYTIEDEAGCRYWLFRSGHYDVNKTYQWYLHGFFA